MPRKKIEEKEEELQVNLPKKKTFASKWFDDYAVNNKTEMKIVCDLTSRSVYEQFTFGAKNGNNEVYAVVFYGTFMSILDFLKDHRKKWKQFTIEICKSINIGYINADNDENEKVGNFKPILEYIGVNSSIVDDSDIEEDTTNENYLRWKELNNTKNIESYNDIQNTAYVNLKKNYKVDLRSAEAVIPVFCIFMDNIVNVLKMKYKEAEGTNVSEVSMNVFGLFDIFYSFNAETDSEIIEFEPNITMKLALKSDEISSNQVN